MIKAALLLAPSDSPPTSHLICCPTIQAPTGKPSAKTFCEPATTILDDLEQRIVNYGSSSL